MPFTNGGGPFSGNYISPLVESPYIETWSFDILSPPPGTSFIITEAGDNIITESGDNLITE